MSDFETWWQQEGQEFLYALNTTTDDDIKLVAEIAWKNGAYKAEQPVSQEPVAYVYEKDVAGIGIRKDVAFLKHVEVGTDLYAAPVRTKDLTEQEIQDAIINISPTGTGYFLRIASAVIAAHKEKNKC